MAVSNVQLRVDPTNAVNGLKKAQMASKQLEGQVNSTGRATASATANIQRFGVSFRSVVGPIVAVTGAVTLLSRSLKVMSDREADIAVLRNGLRGLTTDVGQAVSDLQKVADALGKATLFDEEDFNKGFKLLTSFRTIGVDSYERVAKAAADVAQISGTDVRSAFMQLAKAIDMPERNLSALTRSGILFTKQQSKQIIELKKAGKTLEAQSKLLEVIEAQYTGAADAAGETFAGAIDTLGENFRDLQEKLAKGVAPALTQVVKGMTGLLEVAQRIPAPVGQAALAVGALAAAISGLKAAAASTAVVGLIQTLATLSGVTTATAVGFNAAGAATFAYTTKVSAATVGLGLLKAALVALPWVGVAAGVTFFVSKIIEANTKQKELNETIKTGGREALEAALNTAVLAQAQAQQRIENLKGQRRVTGMAMRNAKADLEAQNANIRAIRDRLGILAEESEKKKESLDLTEKVKDISQNQLDLELRKLQAQKQGDALEVAYLDKLIKREEIMQKEMGGRERTLKLLRTEIEYSERVKEIRKEIADIIAGAQITTAESTFDGSELGGMFTGDEARTKHLDELKEKLKALLDPLNQVKQVSESIADAFSNSIRGMVEGTVTARQALANFFRSVSQSFFNMATEIIKAAIQMMAFNVISSLFPGAPQFGASTMTAPGLGGSLKKPVSGFALGGPQALGKLASGGTATGGRSYLVGERGPELFTPGRTGSVAPAGSFGAGNITVNVDATGSSVQGSAEDSKRLGDAIGLAIRQELIKQKRPGGLLA